MRFEKSGAKGANTCTILGGRVRILRSPLLAQTGEESVPYPFRSQMAKVELEKLSEKSQTCSWRSPTGCREASFGPITCSAYRPNSRLERFSNPFRTVSGRGVLGSS